MLAINLQIIQLRLSSNVALVSRHDLTLSCRDIIIYSRRKMEDLITLQEAATLIGKNLRTIQRHIKNGKLTRHEKDGKNFINRTELEQKLSARGGSAFGGGKISKKSEEKPSSETEASKPQTAADAHESKSPPERLNYEEKWIDEIQKHAQTREELGIWKGRAEAYQAFASRLLGTGPKGVNEKIDLDQNPPAPRPPQISLLYYIAFAVLFVILILLFVIIRIYTG